MFVLYNMQWDTDPPKNNITPQQWNHSVLKMFSLSILILFEHLPNGDKKHVNTKKKMFYSYRCYIYFSK